MRALTRPFWTTEAVRLKCPAMLMRALLQILMVASLASCRDSAELAPSMPSRADCKIPDRYVVRFTETDGDCGAMPPQVGGQEEAQENEVPEGCLVDRDEATCFVTTRLSCPASAAPPEAEGVSFIRHTWLDGAGGQWVGEASYEIKRHGTLVCSSTYSVTVEPR